MREIEYCQQVSECMMQHVLIVSDQYTPFDELCNVNTHTYSFMASTELLRVCIHVYWTEQVVLVVTHDCICESASVNTRWATDYWGFHGFPQLHSLCAHYSSSLSYLF
jgi:hypothetical protein